LTRGAARKTLRLIDELEELDDVNEVTRTSTFQSGSWRQSQAERRDRAGRNVRPMPKVTA
jgi:hypothetical protein